MTTQRLIEQYVTARKRRGAKPGTIANLRWALDSFARHFGARDLRTMGPTHIERWLEDSYDDYSPASLRSMLSTLRGFLRWAERHKHVHRNAANHVESPRQPVRIPRALAAGAPTKILEACPDARARLIVTLMLQQGLRCVEVSRIQAGDVDRHNGTIYVRGKGDRDRIAPLMDESLDALTEYLNEHPCTAGPLIRSYTSRRSLTPGSVSRLVSGWMLDATVKTAPRDGITPHCHRHTMATDMLLAGRHIKDVQAALGHLHLSSAEIYMPHVVRGLDEAMRGRSYGSASRRP